MPSRPEHVDFVSAVEQAPTADALGGRLSELNEELLVLLEQGGAESAEQARALALSLVEASGMQAINGLIARLCEQWRAGEYTDPRQDALYEALSIVRQVLKVAPASRAVAAQAEAAEKNAKAGARATKGALEKAKQAAAALRRRVAA